MPCLLTENTPSGQVLLSSLSAGVKSAGITVAAATSNLPVPAVGDYAGARDHRAQRERRKATGRGVRGRRLLQRRRNAERHSATAGYAGLFTDTIEYDPDLVASSTASAVMLQTAAVETAPTNPAMQQLVADVHTVAPDLPIDQSVVAGYWSADMFIAAVKRAGKNLTVAGAAEAARTRTSPTRCPNTVGPTKFPAAHNEPTPCGSLVRSDGSAYTVLVPYTCGKVVKVKP